MFALLRYFLSKCWLLTIIMCVLVFSIPLWRSDHRISPSADMSITSLTKCPLQQTPPFLKKTSYSGGEVRDEVKHVMMVGHSRLRQLYQMLVTSLDLRQLTRNEEDLILVPLLDRDRNGDGPGPPADQVRNSTCLAASLLPHYEQPNWRCSRASVSPTLLLDFRWRSQIPEIAQLIRRLVQHPQSSPHAIVVTGGIYLLPLWKESPVNSFLSILDLIETSRVLAELLHHLVRRHVRVLWQLEQSANSMSNFDNPTNQFYINVINTVLHEAMALHHVPVWSSHLPPVAHWVHHVCPLDELYGNETVTMCRSEIYHIDQRTTAMVTEQLARYLHLPFS